MSLRQDPRFEWHENSEGNVAVRIKGSPLPLVEVMVRTFDLEDPARLEVAALINGIPEVNGWLKDHSCEMAELFMGRPPTYKWQITMHANNKPLWAILDGIASKSNTFFWSAVQWSNQPCVINLRP